VELVNVFGFNGFQREEVTDQWWFGGGNEEEVTVRRLGAREVKGTQCMVEAAIGKGGDGTADWRKVTEFMGRGWAKSFAGQNDRWASAIEN
jgi:hypothetical protein